MIRNRLRLLFYLSTVAACLSSFSVNSAAKDDKSCRGHLLLQVVKDGDDFEVVRARIVASGIPKQRGQRYRGWRYRVVSKTGSVLFERDMNVPGRLRGELLDRDDPDRVAHVHITPGGPQRFVIRVPLIEGWRIEFYEMKAGDLDKSGALRYSAKRVGAVRFPDIENLK